MFKTFSLPSLILGRISSPARLLFLIRPHLLMTAETKYDNIVFLLTAAAFRRHKTCAAPLSGY